MAKTYEQLQRQIVSLQAEAEKLRRKELEGVVSRIREAIDFYQLTAADLGFSSKAAAPAKAGKGAGRKKAAGKTGSKAAQAPAPYSDGNGGTWAGRGKRPQWLRDALAAGRTLEEFKVGAAAPAA